MANSPLNLNLIPDQQVGPYLIINHLGVGGMGTVFKVLDKRSGTLVALKFINVSESSMPTADQVGRFEQEGRLLQIINHGNVAKVYEHGIIEGRHFIAMEYVEGCDFETINRRLAVPFDAALPLFLQALSGVSALHRSQIIHRDIKPPNILLRADRTVKIVDLGIAKKADESGLIKTEVGFIVGTPKYLAPEVIKGAKANFRSDIWSLGAVFYELLVGQPLIPGQNSAEIFYNHHHMEFWIPEESRNFVTERFVPILKQMCSRSPEERFASCEQILSILRPWAGPHPEVKMDAFKSLIKPIEGEEKTEQYLTNNGLSLLRAKQIKFISIQKTLAKNPMTTDRIQLQIADVLGSINELNASTLSKNWERRSPFLAFAIAVLIGITIGFKQMKQDETKAVDIPIPHTTAMKKRPEVKANPLQDFVPDKIKEIKALSKNLTQITILDRKGRVGVAKVSENPFNNEMRLMSFSLGGGVPVDFGPDGIKVDQTLLRQPTSLELEPKIESAIPQSDEDASSSQSSEAPSEPDGQNLSPANAEPVSLETSTHIEEGK